MYKLLQTERKIQIRADFSIILALIYGITIGMKMYVFNSNISIYEAVLIGLFLFQALCDWHNQYIYSLFFKIVIIINAFMILFLFDLHALNKFLILVVSILIIILSNKIFKLFGKGDEMAYIIIIMLFFLKTPSLFFQKFLIMLIVSLFLFLIVNIKTYIKKDKKKFPMMPEIVFAFLLFV